MATLRDLLADGLAHHRAGRLAEAEACYRRALEAAPDDPEANHLAGVLAFQSGRPGEAADRFARAVAGDGQIAKYHANLGAALLAAGRAAEAVAPLERAAALEPAGAGFQTNLATAYREIGRLDDAVRAYRRVTAWKADDAPALTGLAATLLRQGAAADALATAERAVAADPSDPEAHNVLGLALEGLQRHDAAIAAFRKAVALAPGFVAVRCNLGLALLKLRRFGEAAAQYRAAIEAAPEDGQGYAGLARVLRLQGSPDEALPLYRRAAALAPQRSRLASGVLFHSLADPDSDGRRLCREHREWARRFADPLGAGAAPHANSPTPDRPLRIGYVSPDLRDHPVGRLLLPVLAAHDRAAVEAICYSDAPADAVTESLRAAAGGWRDVAALDDAALAGRMRADGIDILVDLAGHSARNRLLALARRPAPVQATWLGYCSTTGMAAIDWLIADPVHAPPGAEDEFVERIVRLPHDLLCFRPPADAPPVGPAPGPRAGHVTFASFNNPGKLSAAALVLWSRVLAAVPGSRLLIRYMGLEDAEARTRLGARLAAAGIDPSRVDFAGFAGYREVLASYGGVDIALDPTPYSGTMTTLEALWMGVPVVALAGDRMAARQSAAHLAAAGLGDLVARDADGYVALAVALARDPARLSALRAAMRARLQASPLCDVVGFTDALEGAFRAMWRDWCDRRSA